MAAAALAREEFDGPALRFAVASGIFYSFGRQRKESEQEIGVTWSVCDDEEEMVPTARYHD